MQQGGVYVSGSLRGVSRLLPVLSALTKGGGGQLRIVGSSGGALLSAFLSLAPASPEEERTFVALVDALLWSRSWNETLATLRAWVRSLSGGAGCTMRQWAARFNDFQVAVYDYSRSRPILVGADSRAPVASLLAHAILRESPSQTLPFHLPDAWIDVEAIIPAGLLARALVPPPGLHFTSRPAPEEPALTPARIPGAPYVDQAYERLLDLPPVHLAWAVTVPEAASAAAFFNPSRWSSFVRSKWSRRAGQEDAQPDLTGFALALLVWTVLLRSLAVAELPKQVLARGKPTG
jgi:hypothetical protein